MVVARIIAQLGDLGARRPRHGATDGPPPRPRAVGAHMRAARQRQALGLDRARAWGSGGRFITSISSFVERNLLGSSEAAGLHPQQVAYNVRSGL